MLMGRMKIKSKRIEDTLKETLSKILFAKQKFSLILLLMNV